jgi:predicted phosphodiesterase
MKIKFPCLFVFLPFFLLSCSPFQDSPFSDQLFHGQRRLNSKSISELHDIEADGKVRFAVMADSHQNYKDLDEVIFAINQTPDLDFVINLGDLTNSGYNFEYDQFLDHYLSLKAPMITIIGNHDSIGSGPVLFEKAFGDVNDFFESTSFRFLLFNSNNLEDEGRFHPEWLLEKVQSSSKAVIIFTHAPLTDAERFQGNVAQMMNDVIADAHTKIVFNGHNHVYTYATSGGTLLVQAARVQTKDWLLVEIQGSNVTIQRMGQGSTQGATLKP